MGSYYFAAKTVKNRYSLELRSLTANSKPIINSLTMLAEFHSAVAPIIVRVIEKHLAKAKEPEHKLAILYLIDSIVKNVKKGYVGHFSTNLVTTFLHTFEKMDHRMKVQLFRLRQTWTNIFPEQTLSTIDMQAHNLDPRWRVSGSSSSFDPTIHENDLTFSNEYQLVIKQKELIERRQKELEEQLLATKYQLEEQENKLQELAEREQAKLQEARNKMKELAKKRKLALLKEKARQKKADFKEQVRKWKAERKAAAEAEAKAQLDEEMIQKIKYEVMNRPVISKEDSFAKIKSMIQADYELTGGCSYISIPMHCQLTTTRLHTPTKYSTCSHPHCFELEAFIRLVRTTTNTSGAFSFTKCPICGATVEFKDLAIDELFASYLLYCEDRNGILMDSCGPGLKIRIYENGGWEWEEQQNGVQGQGDNDRTIISLDDGDDEANEDLLLEENINNNSSSSSSICSSTTTIIPSLKCSIPLRLLKFYPGVKKELQF